MSEFEDLRRAERQPTVEDVRQLMGASTPHFALHIRNRIRKLIERLPPDHPARLLGEREMARLDVVAYGGERRGEDLDGMPRMPASRYQEMGDDRG